MGSPSNQRHYVRIRFDITEPNIKKIMTNKINALKEKIKKYIRLNDDGAFARINGFTFLLKIAPKGTIWHNEVVSKGKRKIRQRRDNFFGIARYYVRDAGQYIVEIVVGRVQITAADDRNTVNNPKTQAFLRSLDEE